MKQRSALHIERLQHHVIGEKLDDEDVVSQLPKREFDSVVSATCSLVELVLVSELYDQLVSFETPYPCVAEGRSPLQTLLPAAA